MKRIFSFAVIIVFCHHFIANVGCSSKQDANGGANSNNNYLDSSGEGILDDEGNEFDNFDFKNNIYAGMYNDNLNYDFWVNLQNNNQHCFAEYASRWQFITTNRLKITLSPGITATLTLLDEVGNIESQGIPDINGICYLFPQQKANYYTIKIDYFKNNIAMMKTYVVSSDTEIELDGDVNFYQQIDLLFVIDTTGSMINELNYFKHKTLNIIDQVINDNPGVKINLGFIVYRDEHSEYVTKYCDFSSDIEKQISFLQQQIATGGEDYEESVVAALQKAVSLNWSENSIKLLIHIGDAYDDLCNHKLWYQTLIELGGKGIRIISVAGKGANLEVEYLFRAQSLLTNGTYVYLKEDEDDVNIGDSNFKEEPRLYALDQCLVNIINGYYTGNFTY